VTSYGRPVLVAYSLGNFVGHGGFSVTKAPPSFLSRGYDSERGYLFQRTSVLLQFGLQWNEQMNWAEVSSLSYIPLHRTTTNIGYVEESLTEQGKSTSKFMLESQTPTWKNISSLRKGLALYDLMATVEERSTVSLG